MTARNIISDLAKKTVLNYRMPVLDSFIIVESAEYGTCKVSVKDLRNYLKLNSFYYLDDLLSPQEEENKESIIIHQNVPKELYSTNVSFTNTFTFYTFQALVDTSKINIMKRDAPTQFNSYTVDLSPWGVPSSAKAIYCNCVFGAIQEKLFTYLKNTSLTFDAGDNDTDAAINLEVKFNVRWQDSEQGRERNTEYLISNTVSMNRSTNSFFWFPIYNNKLNIDISHTTGVTMRIAGYC